MENKQIWKKLGAGEVWGVSLLWGRGETSAGNLVTPPAHTQFNRINSKFSKYILRHADSPHVHTMNLLKGKKTGVQKKGECSTKSAVSLVPLLTLTPVNTGLSFQLIFTQQLLSIPKLRAPRMKWRGEQTTLPSGRFYFLVGCLSPNLCLKLKKVGKTTRPFR